MSADYRKVSFQLSGGYLAYRQADVDAWVDRVQAARRTTAAMDAAKPHIIRDASFAKSSFGELGYDKRQVKDYLELVRIEFGLPPKKPMRHWWSGRTGMVKVLDPDGVPWTVYRRWFPHWNSSFLDGADPGELGIYLFAVLWPPWLVAKFLGVRWVIVIARSGCEMGDERIRGWGASEQRIHALAESAAAGTLEQHFGRGRRE